MDSECTTVNCLNEKKGDEESRSLKSMLSGLYHSMKRLLKVKWRLEHNCIVLLNECFCFPFFQMEKATLSENVSGVALWVYV